GGMRGARDLGIEWVGVRTGREDEGVALSSRNRRLGAARPAARCVPAALTAAAGVVAGGERRVAAVLGAATACIDAEPQARLEYAELRDPASLETVTEGSGPTLRALAVWVAGVRLIDNRVLVPEGESR